MTKFDPDFLVALPETIDESNFPDRDDNTKELYDVEEIDVVPWGAVEELLTVSAATPRDMLNTVQRLGIETTTDIISNELCIRCDAPYLDIPVQITLEIFDDDQTATRTINVSKSGVTIERRATNTGLARIRLGVLDALEGLFGPCTDKRLPTREVLPTNAYRSFQESLPDRTARLVSFDRIRNAIHAILAACSGQADDLGELAVRFGSDKWPYLHWYTKHYDNHFAPLRNSPLRVLEIGVGGYDGTDRSGASLRMWQRYFRRGLVYGLDIKKQPNVDGPRIRVLQGDQNDPDLLERLAQSVGPFDIIIDDGSHINEHVKTSFHFLFPYVRPGGFYVVEDLFTAYMPSHGGRVDRNSSNSETSIGMLKGLIDGLYYRQLQDSAEWEQAYTDKNVTSVYFHHNMAFIEKGVNADLPMADFGLSH